MPSGSPAASSRPPLTRHRTTDPDARPPHRKQFAVARHGAHSRVPSFGRNLNKLGNTTEASTRRPKNPKAPHNPSANTGNFEISDSPPASDSSPTESSFKDEPTIEPPKTAAGKLVKSSSTLSLDREVRRKRGRKGNSGLNHSVLAGGHRRSKSHDGKELARAREKAQEEAEAQAREAREQVEQQRLEYESEERERLRRKEQERVRVQFEEEERAEAERLKQEEQEQFQEQRRVYEIAQKRESERRKEAEKKRAEEEEEREKTQRMQQEYQMQQEAEHARNQQHLQSQQQSRHQLQPSPPSPTENSHHHSAMSTLTPPSQQSFPHTVSATSHHTPHTPTASLPSSPSLPTTSRFLTQQSVCSGGSPSATSAGPHRATSLPPASLSTTSLPSTTTALPSIAALPSTTPPPSGPPALSRTQQKLYLQRAAPQADPTAPQQPTATEFNTYIRRYQEREFERVTREYRNVRRFRNPLAEGIERIRDWQGHWRVPAGKVETGQGMGLSQSLKERGEGRMRGEDGVVCEGVGEVAAGQGGEEVLLMRLWRRGEMLVSNE